MPLLRIQPEEHGCRPLRRQRERAFIGKLVGRERLGVEQVLGVGVGRRAQHHGVAACQHVVQRVGAEQLVGEVGRLARAALRDMHGKGREPRRMWKSNTSRGLPPGSDGEL